MFGLARKKTEESGRVGQWAKVGLLGLFLASLALPLGACGKKSALKDPPNSEYPKNYPAPVPEKSRG